MELEKLLIALQIIARSGFVEVHTPNQRNQGEKSDSRYCRDIEVFAPCIISSQV